jgi:hypothetical protein
MADSERSNNAQFDSNSEQPVDASQVSNPEYSAPELMSRPIGKWSLIRQASLGGGVLLGIAILALSTCLGLACTGSTKHTLPHQATSVSSPAAAPTRALSSLSIPAAPTSTAYPTDWPSALRFPDHFTVVETSNGTLPDSTLQGWFATLRYQGSVAAASGELASFFTQKGWTVNKTDSGSGSTVLTVDTPDKSVTGAVILEPADNDPGATNVLVSLHL